MPAKFDLSGLNQMNIEEAKKLLKKAEKHVATEQKTHDLNLKVLLEAAKIQGKEKLDRELTNDIVALADDLRREKAVVNRIKGHIDALKHEAKTAKTKKNRASLEAKKAFTKAQKEADKLALKQKKEAEKEAIRAQKEAEKEAIRAQKAEKAALKQKKEAEKEAARVAKQLVAAEKEAARAAKQLAAAEKKAARTKKAVSKVTEKPKKATTATKKKKFY